MDNVDINRIKNTLKSDNIKLMDIEIGLILTKNVTLLEEKISPHYC